MGFFSRFFGTATDAQATVPGRETSPPARATSARVDSWYYPAGGDDSVFRGPDGQPAIHVIPYTDSSGEHVLRLVDDRTGLLIGPTDRRLPKLGLFVAQLRGESYRQADCRAGDFAPGSALRLAREPDNEHDPFAVAVFDATGRHKAGYFNKQKARVVSRVLSEGLELGAVSFRGTPAGRKCDAVGVIAAEPAVLAAILAPRPLGLAMPAHLR
ncbi:HIRAN domain-containing protein [Humibacter sp.]|uniref:HIRAN domain-containing protein n=1 Tax=Humibacter sp. TaxID=1940291 RepID=UPI003F7FE66B